MTPNKRDEIDEMAAAPVIVRLAGREFLVRPLGFGAACLWLKRAALMEGALSGALPAGALGKDGRPQTVGAAAALLDFIPQMEALIFDYLGLAGAERDALDAALGLDFEKSSVEIAAAYFDLAATADPSQAARMKAAKAAMVRASSISPPDPGGRKSKSA